MIYTYTHLFLAQIRKLGYKSGLSWCCYDAESVYLVTVCSLPCSYSVPTQTPPLRARIGCIVPSTALGLANRYVKLSNSQPIQPKQEVGVVCRIVDGVGGGTKTLNSI